MELLIAILFALGFNYDPATVATLSGSTQDINVVRAQHIIDAQLYHYDEDGGVVLEDDVDPNN